MYIDLNAAKAAKRSFEVLSDEIVTEQAGYIPPKIQIENMILAGQRLNMSRLEQYDFTSEAEIDEDAVDPTRSGNFDLSDASQLSYEATQRLNDAAKASKKPDSDKDPEPAVKSSQTAQKAPEDV